MQESSIDNSRYRVLVGLVGRQLSGLRRQLRGFKGDIEQTERQLDEIWQVIAGVGGGLADSVGNVDQINKELGATSLDADGSNAVNKDGSEWSVVDEDEERELTSASLSGYEEYETSEDDQREL